MSTRRQKQQPAMKLEQDEDDSSSAILPTIVVPDKSYRHDDWNALYEFAAEELFVPGNPKLPGLAGQGYWSAWNIRSRKLTVAQPSWYDVQENDNDDDDDDNSHFAREKTFSSGGASQKSTSSRRATNRRKKAPPQSARTSPSTSSSNTKGRRWAPSRGAKRAAISYAEITNDDDAILDVDTEVDDDEEAEEEVDSHDDDDDDDDDVIVIESSNGRRSTRLRRAKSTPVHYAEDDDDDIEVLPSPPKRLRSERSTANKKVTIQWSSDKTYVLHFPAHASSGLGLQVYNGGNRAKFDRLKRTVDFEHQSQPQKGDVLVSIDGVSVDKMSFQKVYAMLTENPGTHPTIVGFERGPVVVTINTEPNPYHDYVLEFPPASEGVGLSLYKEGDKTCFARLLRPAEFSNKPPPEEGDSVETINGEVVGKLGYAGITKILAANAGKCSCVIGFVRKPKQNTAHAHLSFGTTKRINANEYELHLPVSQSTLGIRIKSIGDYVILEQLHRELDAKAQVKPEYGDVIVEIDGKDAGVRDFYTILDLLKHHNGRSVRVLRFQRPLAEKSGGRIHSNGMGKWDMPQPRKLFAQADKHNDGVFHNQGIPLLPGSDVEFEVAIWMTPRGLGMVVTQIGGNAILERFHDFAQVECLGNVSPNVGDEIIAIDGLQVDGLPYDQIVQVLKSPGNKQYRQVRFRRLQ